MGQTNWPRKFAPVPRDLIEKGAALGRGCGSLVTLIGLLSYARLDQPIVWVSMPKLAKRIGRSERTTRRQVALLKRAGLLVDHGPNRNEGRLSHDLEIIWDSDGIPFGKLPIEFLPRLLQLGSLTVGVYSVLCLYRSHSFNSAWPSQGTIAQHLSVSDRAVRNALVRLAKAGFTKRNGYGKGGVVVWGMANILGELMPGLGQSDFTCPSAEPDVRGSEFRSAAQNVLEPGKSCPQIPDIDFRQLDQEDKNKSDNGPDPVFEALMDDPGWFAWHPRRVALTEEALSGIVSQGCESSVIHDLLSFALSVGANDLGREVLGWIRKGNVKQVLANAHNS